MVKLKTARMSQPLGNVSKGLILVLSYSYMVNIYKIINQSDGTDQSRRSHDTCAMYNVDTENIHVPGCATSSGSRNLSEAVDRGGSRGAPGPGPPPITKNEAPAPKFYKIEAPEF